MFLYLEHKKLDLYAVSCELVRECYRMTRSFPDHERYMLVLQIRRAIVSVKLNIAEGASRRSEVERRRYYEIARGSLIEVEAGFEVAVDQEYLTIDSLAVFGELLVRCFSMLSRMLTTLRN